MTLHDPSIRREALAKALEHHRGSGGINATQVLETARAFHEFLTGNAAGSKSEAMTINITLPGGMSTDDISNAVTNVVRRKRS